MMLQGRKVLLIEDNDRLATLYEAQLASQGVSLLRCATGESGIDVAKEWKPAVVLLDIQLPGIDGFEVLRQLSDLDVGAVTVIITSHGSVNWAVEAMRLGAYDFLVKPFDIQRLIVTVSNAVERHDLAQIVEAVARPPGDGYCDFVGGSPAMQSVYRTIAAASGSRASVFITGESGTGKELCARAVHSESPRRGGRFIALNCGAIPRELMESEIFGHRKGAFTGATSDRDGAAALANGGTLFLDEIGEMDMDLQTKLLRFVQTGCYTPVGAGSETQVDVRFVCATNRDPSDAIERGLLREDLFYRLNVIPIHLPPLRDRAEDILPIAEYILARVAREENKGFTGFSPDAMESLRKHRWPGNVRELENAIRNAVVLNEGMTVTAPMLSLTVRPRTAGANDSDTLPQGPQPIRPLADVERDAIENAIQQCDGNVPQAAAALGVAPSTLYRKRQSWLHAL